MVRELCSLGMCCMYMGLLLIVTLTGEWPEDKS